MRKLRIADVRVNVTTRFHMEGSVLAGTLTATPLTFDVDVAVEADEPPETVAELIRVAEQSCYVMQSIVQPVHVERSIGFNGRVLRNEAG